MSVSSSGIDLSRYLKPEEITLVPFEDIIRQIYCQDFSNINMQSLLNLLSIKYNMCKATECKAIIDGEYIYVTDDRVREIEKDLNKRLQNTRRKGKRSEDGKIRLEEGINVVLQLDGKRMVYRLKIGDYDRFKRDVLEWFCNGFKCNDSLFERSRKLVDEICSALEECGYTVMRIRARTKSRLIIGVSEFMLGKFMFEVSLMWDPYLNLPYIPGSSLKGAFRAYLSYFRDEIKKRYSIDITDELIDSILGDNEHMSYILFCDAYPTDCKKQTLLVPEVTTPIYSEQGGRILETLAQPKPLIYPAVNIDVEFTIIVGIRKDKYVPEKYRKHFAAIRSALLQFLSDTLRQGIGAKTMLGYGIMEIDTR